MKHNQKATTNEQPLTLSNRFQVLSQLQVTDSHSGSNTYSAPANAAALTSRGNKNGKGQTLGTAVQHNGKPIDSMDLSDSSFKGNKNKTGQTLGTSMPIVCYADSTYDSIAQIPHTNVDASLTLRGNKNGKGQTLGTAAQQW